MYVAPYTQTCARIPAHMYICTHINTPLMGGGSYPLEGLQLEPLICQDAMFIEIFPLLLNNARIKYFNLTM